MGVKLLPSKRIANLAQMVPMILSPAVVDKNVVEVDDNEFANEWAQDLIHQPLECTRHVREAERHNSPLVETILYLKGGLPLMPWTNPNLVISASQINL